ncbi:hypothetical protein [Pedobacter sp. Bi27]|uniref:hypothetical protein n=1 Tax=Pedobacter sp. Bi27 TaxID=2822351 RepID=UPI001E48C54A|nr:hypothetical protein [Pedobacter sp. Bi27]
MMEGENVKALAPPFNLPLPRGSTLSPILHRGLVLATQKALTNLSDISSKPFSYALVFVVLKVGMLSLRSGLLLFHQGKSKSHSAAVSRGKTARRAKQCNVNNITSALRFPHARE